MLADLTYCGEKAKEFFEDCISGGSKVSFSNLLYHEWLQFHPRSKISAKSLETRWYFHQKCQAQKGTELRRGDSSFSLKWDSVSLMDIMPQIVEETPEQLAEETITSEQDSSDVSRTHSVTNMSNSQKHLHKTQQSAITKTDVKVCFKSPKAGKFTKHEKDHKRPTVIKVSTPQVQGSSSHTPNVNIMHVSVSRCIPYKIHKRNKLIKASIKVSQILIPPKPSTVVVDGKANSIKRIKDNDIPSKKDQAYILKNVGTEKLKLKITKLPPGTLINTPAVLSGKVKTVSKMPGSSTKNEIKLKHKVKTG